MWRTTSGASIMLSTTVASTNCDACAPSRLEFVRLQQQREAELAALGQHQAGAQRHAQFHFEQPPEQRDERGLEHEQPGDRGENPEPLRRQHAGIELHADGDEKQPEQDVAERQDVGLDLMAVFGFAEHHAGQERAERERQSRRLRDPCRR